MSFIEFIKDKKTLISIAIFLGIALAIGTISLITILTTKPIQENWKKKKMPTIVTVRNKVINGFTAYEVTVGNPTTSKITGDIVCYYDGKITEVARKTLSIEPMKKNSVDIWLPNVGKYECLFTTTKK